MAGTIDELNFKVILDDTSFNTQAQNDIQVAKELNTQLSNLLDLKSKASKIKFSTGKEDRELAKTAAAAANAAAAQERLRGATANANAAEDRAVMTKTRLVKMLRSANAAQNTLNKSTGMYSRLLREVTGLAAGYLSIRGVSQFVSELVRVTGEFEKQEKTLGAILQDVEGAKSLISDLKGLAVESPFQFKDLATYAKQLSAYSVPMEELYDTTRMLADVSAGLGVGMDRLILAYGQVRSAAFLRGQEVRQFTEAGLPILEELAKQFEVLEGRAVSAGEVFDKISSRLVPFEMVAKIFEDLTSEGGKFYEMQAVQAETLAGKVSNLRDAYEIMLNEIGSSSGILKGSVDMLRKMMLNWEKIGTIIKGLIAGFGAYGAVLAVVWARQKLVTLSASVKTFKHLLDYVKWNTAAMTAFGISSKAALGGALGLAAALVTVLASAISNAGKLRRELDKILSEQDVKSTGLVETLDALVDSLKNAKQGTQEYRDAIAEINRRYGDYLPNLLNEKMAYEDVATAADKAREAIMAKARANAFEQGQAAIEEDYGADYTKQFNNLRDVIGTLTKNTVSKKAASDFVKNFKTALLDEANAEDPWTAFLNTFGSYFGEDKYEWAKGIFGDAWDTLEDRLIKAVKGFSKVAGEMNQAERDLQENIENRMTASQYDSIAEQKALEEINEWYAKQEASLKKTEMSAQQYAEKIDELNIEKLKKLVAIYGEQGDELTRNADKAKKYQAQLDELTKVQKGWRGTVNEALKVEGIKGKQGAFGLWAEETTKSAEYVDKMVKRLKELKEERQMISSFDKEGLARIDKEASLIRKVAKALNIDIDNLVKISGKDNPYQSQIADLKRRADAIKEVMNTYNKWVDSGLFKDKTAKQLLGNVFGDIMGLDANGRLKTNFEEQINDIITKLKQYGDAGEEAAKQVEAAFGKATGKEQADDIFDRRKEQIEKITDAIEKYYEKLSKWKGEDFNLGGTGVDFDIRKIAAELTSEMSEIDRRANELKTLFASINLGGDQKVSEDTIETVKSLIIKEHGEEVWDKFWELYKKGGIDAINDVAEAERNANKATAKDKLVGLAEAKVRELTRNLDMTDWADKSLSQINTIMSSLEGLLDGGFNLTDSATEEKLKGLGLTLDDLKAAIIAILTGKFNNTTEEKFKKLQDKAKQTASVLGDMAGSLEGFGEAIGSDFLVQFGKGLEVAEEFAGIILECDSLWKTMADSVKKTTEATEAVAENAGELADSSDWITMVIKVVLLAVEQIANAISAADAGQRALNESASKYRDILHEIALEQADTIWGENYSERMKANLKNAKEAYDLYNAELQRLLGQDRGGVKHRSFNLNDNQWSWDVIKDLQGLIDYYDLLDENGNLDMEWIKGNLDALIAQTAFNGTKLKGYLEKDLEGLVELYDAYKEAYAQIKSDISEMLGQTAGDFADHMIDSFLEIGNAADDLGAVFENLGRTILESLVSGILIEDVLKKYTDQMTDLYAQQVTGQITPEEFAEKLGGVAGLITKDMENIAPAIEAIIAAFQENGLLPDSMGKLESSLSSGIKGITEDTANLLASYLNAIRADVSMGKVHWQNMDASLAAISKSIPNIAEYLAQVAANTYDTAVNTQSIMEDLRSVLVIDRGQRAIRILS